MLARRKGAVRCIGCGIIFIVNPHPEHEGAQYASSFADPSAQSLLWHELRQTVWKGIQKTVKSKKEYEYNEIVKADLLVFALLLASFVQGWLPVGAWSIVHLGADNNDAIERLAAHFKARQAHLLLTGVPTLDNGCVIGEAA